METDQAIAALSALAHEHRLRMFRLLMRRAPSGMAAGEIASAVGIGPSSVTFHAGALERAGLIGSRREQRHVFYAVEIDAMRRLVTFLTEDCCNGHPEICGDLAAWSVSCTAKEEVEG